MSRRMGMRDVRKKTDEDGYVTNMTRIKKKDMTGSMKREMRR